MLAVLKKTIGLVSLFVLLTGSAFAQSSQTLEVQADAALQQLLRDAETRLANNDSAAAWSLLSPHEAELAGNAYYDYLLGVAALDTGRTSEAIFSLQRSIGVEPRFSGARMELARAHFENGDKAQARPLFVSLLSENPPARVRDVLHRYIDTIDARPAVPRASFSTYVEFGGGYDSNANGSTNDQQFLGFTLSPDNIETSSPFAEIAGGFSYARPNNATTSWYLAGRASYRNNPDASFVDPGVVSGLSGFSWRRGAFYGRAGVDAYWAMRDGKSNEAYGGLDLLLGRHINERWNLIFALRGGAVRYDDAIEVLNVNRVMYTLGAAWQISPLASLGFEALGGQDSETESGSPYGNSKLGGRLSLRAPLGRVHLFASVGSLESDFDGLFFGVPRKDTQLTSILQLEFRDLFAAGLSLIPRVRYVENDSDVALYKYDRTEFGLTLRWIPQ